MKFLTMFFASLRMAKTLDSKHFSHDSERGAELIGALCPEDGADRITSAQSQAQTSDNMAPKAA